MSHAQQGIARRWLAPITAVVALLAFASSAPAAQDPIEKGVTDLHMKKGFQRKLSNLGVTVLPLGTGAVDGKKISLIVRSGKLDPTDAKGFLETGSGFRLQRGARGVPITKLTLNTETLSVSAEIARVRMQLGVLTPPTFSREGFGSNFRAVKLSLTEKAARRISNKLGLQGSKRLNPGRVLSNAYSTAQPLTVTLLPQGSVTLTPSPVAIDKFTAKGVKVPEGITAITPATKPNAASLQFPISGGTLAPGGYKGTVETAGGVQILKEAEPFSPALRLRNISIDFDARAVSAELEILPKPPFAGAVGRSTIVEIVLPQNSVKTNPVTRTIEVQAEARLQAGTASTLNDVFNQPAPQPPPSSNFVVGDLLGNFSLVAQGQ